MMKRFLASLIAAAGVGSVVAAGHEQAWRLVRGEALQMLFADRDLGDGVHYAYQFHRDGSLSGMNMGKPTRGEWKVSGQYLCYRWSGPGSEEECYEVRKRGQEIRMFRDGYEAFSGSLTPIEPSISKETKP